MKEQHQFPIFVDANQYAQKVGTRTAAKTKGPLGGVTHGLGMIEQLQPYNRQPEPRADQLWGIYRFSNADKHRQIATRVPVPLPKPIDFDFNGRLVDKDETIEIPKWVPEEPFEIARLRFDPPMATNLRVRGKMALAVVFTTGPFGNDPDPVAIEMAVLRDICEYVAAVVGQFEAI